MTFLFFTTTMYFLISCGIEPSVHEVKGSGILLRKIADKKYVGKIVDIAGLALKDGEMFRPLKTSPLHHLPLRKEARLRKKSLQTMLRQREFIITSKGLQAIEARAYLNNRKTFFHTFFAMRDAAGDDTQLIKMLNISTDTYFKLRNELQLPDKEQLHEILKVVMADFRLQRFHRDLKRTAKIERIIEEGKLYHKITNRIVRNSDINTSIKNKLLRIRRAAEQDVALQNLGQPELLVNSWLINGKTSSEILQEMAESIGNLAALSKKLDIHESLLSRCMRGISKCNAKIEEIVTELNNLDDSDALKPFAAKLERSLAIEKAIDAGAVMPIHFHAPLNRSMQHKFLNAESEYIMARQRLYTVDEHILHEMQLSLQAKRQAASNL